MEANTFWVFILAVSTPIAGIVGFAIQLRQVRKAKLENEKLLLEIEALKVAAEAKERRVQLVSTEEILKYGRDDIMFSRSGGVNPGSDYPTAKSSSGNFGDWLIIGSAVIIGLVFLFYAIYDFYRLFRWVWSAL